MCFERLGLGSEVRKGYIDKVIIELRPEALVEELGKDSWEELSEQKEKHVQRPRGLLKHDYQKIQLR